MCVLSLLYLIDNIENVIESFPSPQMEELLDTGCFVFSHDFRLFPHDLYGTCGSCISGKCHWLSPQWILLTVGSFLVFYLLSNGDWMVKDFKKLLVKHHFFFSLCALFPTSDTGHDCPNQVLPRNHYYRLQSLPFLWTALVQDTKLVRRMDSKICYGCIMNWD